VSADRGPPPDTSTFLFTDIEGSTRRWEQEPEAMADALARHDQILRDAIEAHGGHLFKHTGDGVCAVFGHPCDALTAAIAAQHALLAEAWPVREPLRSRMGVHTGVAIHVDDDFFGPTLNRAARIMAAGHGGQILASGTSVRLLHADDREHVELVDLGEHELRDLTGVEHLFQVGAKGLPSDFGRLRVLSTYRHNLPHQPTEVIGRAADVERIVGLLRSHRLVTLTGIGGCGKSRLALQAGAEALPDHGAGAWLVDLTSVSGPSFVARAIAKGVGHGERLAGQWEGDQPGVLAQLCKLIGDAEMLIITENCEHYVQSVAECVAALLRGCPNVRVLATSREALRTAGELVYPVPPLSMPPVDSTAAELLATASGELFAERAASVQPSFEVTEQNAPHVGSICRRLDGLPLAIELAAARIRVLSPQQIDERLADALALLKGGDRTSEHRHQTLTATLEWSHDTLSESERALLRRLSVFSDGFSLEAAESVCGTDPLEAFEVLDLLSALVDRSLVSVSTSEPVRFHLLEVVRQFAAGHLDAAGETALTRRRHFEWALDLAERAAPIEHVTGTRELASETANLRVAFQAHDLGIASGDERLLLAYTLWRYMSESGRIPEGRAWLDTALSGDCTPGTVLYARALDAAGFLASLRGDFDRARELVGQALTLCRILGDPLAEGWTLLRFGLVNGVQGLLTDSSNPFHEALDIFKRERYVVGQRWAHLELGRALFTADEVTLARHHFELAMRPEHEVRPGDDDDETTIRYGTVGVEACRMLQGEDRTDPLAAAVSELTSLNMLYTSTQGLLVACAASIHHGNHRASARYSAEALAITHMSGGTTQSLHAVEWAAQSLAGLERWEAAEVLWGYVSFTRERLGAIEPPLVSRLQAPLVAAMHARFGAEQLQAAKDRSASLTVDDIVRIARRELDG
jgi:predicted ATPase/class 3 adenylate cyclase